MILFSTPHPLPLQLFAVQTTATAGTGNELSPELKTYYDRELLEDTRPRLAYAQFGQKKPIPQGGGKTVEWRRFSRLPKAASPITEGVTPAGNKLDVQTLTGTVAQYGDFIQISDLLELTAVDNVVLETTRLLGNQAGLTLDTVVREALMAGTNVLYAPRVAADGTETAVTSRAGLDATAKLTVDVVYQAVHLLKKQNVDPIGDSYVAIIHPDVAYDLMRSADWLDAHKYADPQAIYAGEIGKLGGVRFVESSEAKIFTGEGCPAGLAVYGCLFIGSDAYGVTELAGGGLEHILKQKGSAGTADPLDQRSSVGWKATQGAKILNDAAMVRVECCSRFSAVSEAN